MSRRGRRWAVVLVLVLVAVGGAAAYLGPVASLATGYAAKTACSGHLVAGRPLEAAASDLPAHPVVPLLRTEADVAAGSVSASLLGLWDSAAWHTPGAGCTLADDDPGFAPLTVPPSADGEWPTGDRVDVAAARSAVAANGPALDAAVQGAFVEDDPDGEKRTRAVVVVREGRVVAEQYAAGFDADTELLGWSMGKSVANAVVGRLVHEGRLSLDDAGLRDAWRDDERSTITVAQLLHMTSGLAFDETEALGTDLTSMLYRAGDTGAFAAAKGLVADPGTRWSYSSGTTNILCDVAQDASGMGIEMARELVFAPLGMASAVLEPDAAGGLVCSSFPYATARDWARFGQFFLQEGSWDGRQLLPADWVAWSTTPVELPTENPYGAHWWLNTGADGDQRMERVPDDAYWANGNEGQHVVVIPSQRLVVVRLGFTSDFDGIDWGLQDLLVDVLDALPDLAAEAEAAGEADAAADG